MTNFSAYIQLGARLESSFGQSFAQANSELQKLGSTATAMGAKTVQASTVGATQVKRIGTTATDAFGLVHKAASVSTGQIELLGAAARKSGFLTADGAKIAASAFQQLDQIGQHAVGQINTAAKTAKQSLHDLGVAGQKTGSQVNNGARHGSQGVRDLGTATSSARSELMQLGAAWASMKGIQKTTELAADLEHELKQAAITAGMTKEETDKVRLTLLNLAVPEKTNQSVKELNTAFKTLVSTGLKQDLATASLYAIGRTATAASADITDLSKASYTLINALKIKPEGLTAELDRLAFLGNEGRFELKDMAKSFPVLASGAVALKMKGSEAVATLGAALQIAMDGAGSQDEAANNLANFMNKALSPETIKKFKEHGIDIVKVYDKAIASGGNPFEALIEKVNKATKGGDQVRLGQLFQDTQVQNFLRPMLQNLDKYKKLKSEAMAAKGVVDNQYADIMETAKEQTKAFNIEVEKTQEKVGRALLVPLGKVAGVLRPVVTLLGQGAERFPATTMTIVGLGAALTILPPVITLVTTSFIAMNYAMLANPIGLTVAAIVLAGAAIYDNWEPIKEFFIHIWDDVKKVWTDFSDYILNIWDKINKPLEAVQVAWNGMVNTTSKPDFEIIKKKGKPEKEPAVTVGQAANDNAAAEEELKAAFTGKPGTAVAAAQARAQAAMAKPAALADPTAKAAASASAATNGGKIVLELVLPTGAQARTRSNDTDLTIAVRNGAQMAGIN